MKPAEHSITEPLIRVELFKVGSTTVTITTLVIALVIVLLSFLFSRAVRAGMRRFFQRSGLAPTGEAGAVERLVHYGIVLSGVLVAMRTTGIRLDALFAAGAVFAVGFGFAMQNIAQNFVSGVILLFERTIKPGDVIEVGGQIVKVQQMSIRATIVRTLDEEDVIVPNSSLVQSNVKNFTLEDNIYRVRVNGRRVLQLGRAQGEDRARGLRAVHGLSGKGLRAAGALAQFRRFGARVRGFGLDARSLEPSHCRLETAGSHLARLQGAADLDRVPAGRRALRSAGGRELTAAICAQDEQRRVRRAAQRDAGARYRLY